MKCAHCGRSLGDRSCPACGTEVLSESLFCHRCGRSLEAAPSPTPSAEGEETDFSKRILCSDGNCIGVVNEQGICKVCGKPYAGEAR
jgi:RNA polymerase subunit RPABC4/transcription elongation factor Spt4